MPANSFLVQHGRSRPTAAGATAVNKEAIQTQDSTDFLLSGSRYSAAHAACSRYVSCRHPCVSRNDGLIALHTVQSQQLDQRQAAADGTRLNKLYVHISSLPASMLEGLHSMHPVIGVTCSA